MKIILADCHGSVMGKEQSSANLSLLYLAAYTREKADFQVEFRYIPQVKSDDYHLQMIEEFEPRIYAISFTSFTALVAYELIRRIKKQFPHVLVVCGGVHTGFAFQEVLEKSGADIAAIGEGEVTFLEIVKQCYLGIKNWSEVKGIAYMENGVCRKSEARPLIDDLDTLPFPARDLVNDDDFCGLSYSKSRFATEMVVTRGCPLRCVFCANPVFRLKNGPLFRSRSPENIALEAEELYQMGYREIYIHSDELNVQLKWSIDVCKALTDLGHKDLFFQANLRVIPMSEEFAYWLKQANFWLVRIGLETTSNRVLSGIKKQMSFHKTERTCKILTEHGIKIFGFTMLYNYWEENGKVQHETTAEVRKTIKDIYRLWWKGYINYTSWGFARPVHGAELYDIALKHGMIDKDYYPSDTWDTFDHLKGITKKEFNSVYKSARRQQGVMALRAANNIGWRNYKVILRKAKTMMFGKPSEVKIERV